MVDRITTFQLSDLTLIFDANAQEQDDVGDARVLYTFDDSQAPIRNRVVNDFILDVQNPKLSFFVSAPIDDNIKDGTIILSKPIEGVQDNYSLSEVDRLVQDISFALGDGDDEMVAQLLQE